MRLKGLKIILKENVDHPIGKSTIGWKAQYDGLPYGDFIRLTEPTPSASEVIEATNLLLMQAIGCIEVLESESTADVEKARLGNAICGDYDEWWGAVYECSLCGEKWMLESSSYKTHYCPWCGANMDGERKEQG